jgi:hypothetical protein
LILNRKLRDEKSYFPRIAKKLSTWERDWLKHEIRRTNSHALERGARKNEAKKRQEILQDYY